jgi:diguanylate cyclase (GGDEF)-like protein
MNRLHQWMSALPRAATVTVAICLTLVAALMARAPGVGGTLWVLAFIPIAIGTWYAGWTWGVALVVLSLLASAPHGPSGRFVPPDQLELSVRMALMGCFVLALGSARSVASGRREPPRSDPSTGLANARVLFDFVTAEVDRAQRYGRSFTLAYIAIENLPSVRRGSGRDAAEDVLRRTAHQISGSLRSVDVAARLRDQEFALLLPETGVDAARAVLGRIQRSLSVSLAEEPYPVSFTVGATTWLQSDLAVEALHQRTYQLMYAARQSGTQINHEVLGGDAGEETTVRHLTIR